MSSPRPRDLLMLLLLAGIWSSSFLFIKIAVPTLPPLTLAAGRLWLAALLLLVVAARRGQLQRVGARTWRDFLAIGLIGNAAPFVLIHWGELSIDSSQTAILMGVMPLATVLLAHRYARDERLDRTRLGGVLIGFAGLLVLLGRDALGGLGAHLLAELAILGAALCYAVNTVYIRRAALPGGTLMAAGSLSVGALLLTPLALAVDQPWQLQPSAAALGSLLMLGLFSTGAAALMYFHLIRQVGATFFSQVNYLIPALGALWGWALLGERPSVQAWLALACIITGLALVNRGQRRPPIKNPARSRD